MNGPRRVGAVCVAALLAVALAAPGSATAKPAKISGKLSAPGYTVIALAASGQARTDQAPQGKFKLRPPANKFTLHLRAANGTYAGPIVIGKAERGKLAILGLREGAKLGKVKINSAKGYAKPAKRLSENLVDAKCTARAKKGVPIGAGNFGLVKSKKTKGGIPGDLDLDGVADSLDIDDDGDLILDDYDQRSPNTSASPASGRRASDTFPGGEHLLLGTRLAAPATAAVNVNGGSSDAQIAAAQQSWGELGVNFIGIDEGSGELDCGTLVYCTLGGTGRVKTSDFVLWPDSPRFPECCDADHDGFGTLNGDDPGGVEQSWAVWHGATAEQIRAGDVLILRAMIDGVKNDFAAALGYVFSTFPVIASYDDGQGSSGSFSYPRPGNAPAAPVHADPTGAVALKLQVWRPQRRRIEGEPGDAEWMDVGSLSYAAQVASPSGGNFCPQSSFSTTDPNLAPVSSSLIPGKGAGGFEDLAGDQPADPANTFTFSLDLTQCLAANGASLGPNEVVRVTIWGVAVRDPGTLPKSQAFSISSFVRQP